MASAEGASEVVEASDYEVNEDRSLALTLDSRVVRTWSPGQWVTVDEVGIRLANEWPAPGLDDLLQTLKTILGLKYGHYVHHVGTGEKYTSAVFNELDAFAGAVLASVGIAIDSTNDRSEIVDVRGAIAHTFNVRVPAGSPRPSRTVTALRCPQCGDVLRANGRGLVCPTADMDFSPRVAEALRDFCQAPPAPTAERATSTNWGGNWFCPNDGMRLESSHGLLPACQSCLRILPGDLLYQLIEFHVHRH